MTALLGLDIGATRTRCAIGYVDDLPASTPHGAGANAVRTDDITLDTRIERATPQGPTADAFCDEIGQIVTDTLDAAGIDPSEIVSAGIASFGPLDVERGHISQTPNIDADLRGVPIRAAVEGLLPDANIVFYNDATAGVLAEYHADGTADSIAYVTFSSGVGAGVVVDGTLLRGEHGNAAEVGHITLDPDADVSCGCGGTGHWEAFAGGENIPEYAADIAMEAGFDAEGPEDATAKAIFDAVGDNALATETVTRIGRWNTLGMAAVVQAYDPAQIIVGGAVALNNEDLVLNPIQDKLGDYIVGPAPDIECTQFGDVVVLWGALVGAATRLD